MIVQHGGNFLVFFVVVVFYTIDVINVKLCMMVLLIGLYPFFGVMSLPCLESQGCHLIPLCYRLSCSSA